MKNETFTGVIYKFQNKLNGKIYIGQSRKEHNRYNAHIKCKNPIYEIDRAIQKYGIENFNYNILCSYITSTLDAVNDWMDKNEEYYISYFNCIYPNGYNLLSGGNHPVFSDITRQRISEACKGEKNGFYGKKHSDESKKKMSESAKKRGPNRLGTQQPVEAIEKTKRAYRNWWNGLTDEQKKEHHKKCTEHNKKQINFYINGQYVKTFNSVHDTEVEMRNLYNLPEYIINLKLYNRLAPHKYDHFEFHFAQHTK